ncbi:YjgN family protein [Deinococcus budaensis]|uniref:Uncharacterized membrane protein YjgN (DUF898 family) n=1 Tax=Deinococcus budaensis TaxID=1665626 RepID=A0A7W8GD88_9DEIO|nr:DUF898 family protein [Deinococcus budaensis]MBB5233213.1 uncharacterized membrane protein YjgN (DUF898 family) [Deinococcus budaensis]
MTDAPPPAPLGRHDRPSGEAGAAAPGGDGGAPQQPASPVTAATVTTHPLSFTGQAGEYFRIWIVNTALTVVTLGLYLPWARVRQRRYFYGHTWLDGQNFDYTARPAALLRAYLLVGAFFLAYSLALNLQFSGWEYVAGVIAAAYLLLYPWLVMKSLRFLAASTTHRGLAFRHHGRPGGSYLAYGVGNVAAALSAGLALPWGWFMQRRYQVEHAAYGTARATFRGDVGDFYLIGLTGLAVGVGGGLLLGAPLVAALAVALGGADLPLPDLGSSGLTLALVAGAYLLVLGLYAVAWQYVRAATLRLVLNHVEVGGVVRTGATFRPWTLVWIGVSNAVVQALTLGLATPWAAVRRARYVTQGIQVRALVPLGSFCADVAPGENALGEAATELLDINLGF